MKIKQVVCPKCHQMRDVIDRRDMRMMRKKAGYTLRQTAGEVGISVSYLHDIEFGRRQAPQTLIDYWRDHRHG